MKNSISRRKFVAGTGALVVGFGTTSRISVNTAWAQAAASASPSLTKAPQLDSWIRIGAGGEVTVLTGKVEIGQGIKTALAQIAAEELDVAGIATDYCVRATVLDALKEGFKVRLLGRLSAGVAQDTSEQAVAEMSRAGAQIA